MKPAIVLGTHTMGLGVIRALGIKGVPVVAVYYNEADMGYVSRYVLESFRFPQPEKEESFFVSKLIRLADRYKDSPLFPVSDETLKVVSKHKAELSAYYKVGCVDWDIARQVLEKSHTYQLAASLGVPIPKTIILSSCDEISRYLPELDYPILVKPIESHRYYALFRRKIVKVFNQDQLISACQEAVRAGLDVMLQELIPGDDAQGVNYNSYFWNGNPLVEFTAKKIRSAPPELGSPCALKSQMIPEVLESGRKMLHALGYYGYSCTEFKCDPRDGIYKLVEINGRHNLSTLLAVNCGINFPWLQYQHLVDELIPKAAEFREGFYWVDTERDLTTFPQRVFHNKEAFLPMFLPYFKPHVQAVFDLNDPRPFIKRYLDFFRAKARQLFHSGSKNKPILQENRP